MKIMCVLVLLFYSIKINDISNYELNAKYNLIPIKLFAKIIVIFEILQFYENFRKKNYIAIIFSVSFDKNLKKKNDIK